MVKWGDSSVGAGFRGVPEKANSYPSGFTIPDPTDSNIVWATCYGNEVTRYDHRTRLARSVSPSFRTLDSPPNTIKWRAHWTPPLAIDPFDHNTVYYGTQFIHKTTDGGSSWTVISPDLSTADPRYSPAKRTAGFRDSNLTSQSLAPPAARRVRMQDLQGFDRHDIV